MAQRRMTSLEVIDTDAFLDMPVSSQLLYFHLNARADDDGFVASPKKIVRVLGAAGDDFKLLIAKKFLIAFDDGVCVIKHWRVNNFIRKDIYKETQYLDLKRTLFIRPNGAYTQTDDGRAIQVPDGHFKVEAVESTLTQRQLRIGKEREDTSEVEDDVREVSDSIIPFQEESTLKRPAKYPNAKETASWLPFQEKSWFMNTTELKHLELLHIRGEKKVRSLVSFIGKHKDDPYCPKFTKPSDLERKWRDYQDYADKND